MHTKLFLFISIIDFLLIKCPTKLPLNADLHTEQNGTTTGVLRLYVLIADQTYIHLPIYKVIPYYCAVGDNESK